MAESASAARQPANEAVVLRPARPGEGAALFDTTVESVRALAAGRYSPEQIAGWMGARSPAYYEDIIARGRTVVAEAGGEVVGFVDAEPGEVTRLFLKPKAAGRGLGGRLLALGIAAARQWHDGAITVEATLNAERFYARHGFLRVRTGFFSHGLGGAPIEVVVMERPAAAGAPA